MLDTGDDSSYSAKSLDISPSVPSQPILCAPSFLFLIAFLELAYLCDRTGSHSNARSLVRKFVIDFNDICHDLASDFWKKVPLELCIANIGSITAQHRKPQHVVTLQGGLEPFCGVSPLRRSTISPRHCNYRSESHFPSRTNRQ